MQLGGRPLDDWVQRYVLSHQNPVNRACHMVGIPLIALSLPLLLASPFVEGLWRVPTGMFVVGWILQFAGHAAEGKLPEFFHDWRFLFVGFSWWLAKVTGHRAGRHDPKI